MITLDPKTQAIISTSHTKPITAKNTNPKIKFTKNRKTSSKTKNINNKDVIDIGHMLFLQEIDVYAEDKKNLQEYGEKALKSLKELLLALTNNELSIENLYYLKSALENRTQHFTIPEITQIANDITLRLEVEIAKIEATIT